MRSVSKAQWIANFDVEPLISWILRGGMLISMGLAGVGLVRLSLAVLLLTPTLRVVVSMVYFAVVDRRWKQTLLTGFVLAVLVLLLVTDVVRTG